MTAPACARLGVGLIAFGLSLAAGADDSSPSATFRQSAADHDDSYLYRLPYGNEASFSVLQTFGSRLSHRGSEYYTIDFGMPEGTIVFSAREGTIVDIEDRFDQSCWAADCAGYANYIVIRHPDQTLGKYFHLQQDSIVVEPGQWVERGVPIARSGDTGYATSPHLHFGVYQPLEDGGDRSIAIQFAVRGGFVGRLRAGGRYTNRID